MTVVKAISGALLAVSAHVHAASFDCRKAMPGPETFICRHEAISKLDKQLSSAYQAQMKNLPSKARSAVMTSQRSWLAYWPRTCSASSVTIQLEDDALDCAVELYRLRIMELNMPPLNAGGAFYTVSEFRFLSPQSEHETAANHTISFPQIASNSSRDLQLNAWLARDIHKWRSGLDKDSNSGLTVALTFFTPVLIQTTETATFFGHGAAHPQTGVAMHYFLPGAGRPMQVDDFFNDNGWVKGVANHLFKMLLERLGDNLQVKDAQELQALMTQPSRWLLNKGAFSLQFNPYEVGPYSEGIIEAQVPLALIRAHLTPFGRDWLGIGAR